MRRRRMSETWADTTSRATMPPHSRIACIRGAFGRFRAVILGFGLGRDRSQASLRLSSASIASEAVRAVLADAAHAEACVTELEKLEDRYSTLETAHLPSVRARIERIGSRVRKARSHAKLARAHADTAVLIVLGRIEGHSDSASGDLKHHVDLAKQSCHLADELLEISLASEKRERSRITRRGRKLGSQR